MALTYKTRGMSSAKGKPKVFFFSHPEDFDAFFEPISEDILAKQNCAIWYDREDVPLDEEREADLEGMQLFVVPVTTKMLLSPNRARDEYFPFAIRKHIPVLPLMQEGGLDQVFNEKCGDFQYLDKNVRDVTAISYDEKLEKFLSSVLVGDELAEKVRAAFDAYIFLSYRKKDRRHAQELMRLIHKNKFCRDIAIWYDEFLVPGENFNDAISDALQKCDLFALAVTPNLVNEDNYVMRIEYPAARDAGKTILPAEVVYTDRDQIREKYQGIPDCVDAHNDQTLSDALLKNLKTIALEENDGDAEHNFFIGLAYLNGIDVETEPEMARKLITGSAEAGLPEAMEKLVDMYSSGMGVERDRETALQWQRRLADVYRNVYRQERTVDSFLKLFDVLRALCGILCQLRMPEEALETCEEMIRLGKKESRKSPEVRRSLIIGYLELGNVEQLQGRLQVAITAIRKALNIVESICDWNETSDNRALRRTLYYRLIGIYIDTGDIMEAAKTHRILSEIFRDAIDKSESDWDYTESARACVLYSEQNARLLETVGLLSDAYDQYLDGLAVCEDLAKESADTEDERYLTLMYSRLASTCMKRWYLTKARYYCQLALERNLAAAETGTLEAQCDLAQSYAQFSELLRRQNKSEEAMEQNQKAMEILEALSEKTAAEDIRKGLIPLYIDRGGFCLDQGKPEEALRCFERAADLCETLIQQGVDELENKLITVYYHMGAAYAALGDLSRADDLFSRARKSAEKQMKKLSTPLDLLYRSYLIDFYAGVGAVYESQGMTEEAFSHYDFAAAIGERLAEKGGTPDLYEKLAKCYRSMENLRRSGDGGIDTAADACRALAKEIQDALDAISEEEDRDFNLSFPYKNVGLLRQATGQENNAGYIYQSMLARAEEQEEATNSPQDRRALAESYFHMGQALLKKEPKEALAHYNKGMEISVALTKESGWKPVRERLDLPMGYQHSRTVPIPEPLKEPTGRSFFLRKKENGKLRLAYDCVRLGGDCETQGRLPDALEHYLSGQGICYELMTGNRKSSQAYAPLYAFFWSRIVDLYHSNGALEEANESYAVLLTINSALADWEETDWAARRAFAAASSGYAYLLLDLNRSEEAREYFKNALEVRRKLAEATRSLEDLHDAACAYWDIGMAATEDKPEERREYLRQAHRIWSSLSEEYPKNSDFEENKKRMERLLKD